MEFWAEWEKWISQSCLLRGWNQEKAEEVEKAIENQANATGVEETENAE